MNKVKIADKREIDKVPLKQISTERRGSPFLSSLEQQHFREKELPVTKLDFRSLIKRSEVATLAFTLPASTSLTLTMALTLTFEGLTLAIPRWSLYNSSGVDINRPPFTNDYSLWPAKLSYERTIGIDNLHILTIGLRDDISSDQDFTFAGDWLYIGESEA